MARFTLTQAAAAATFTAALAACNGVQPPAPKTFDVTQLEFRDENGNPTSSSAVSQIASFRAVFSDNVKANTLTNSNITLSKVGSNTNISLAINGANFSNSASIASVNEVLQLNTQYRLTFSEGIESESGAKLNSKSYTFTVTRAAPTGGKYQRFNLANVTNPTSIALLNDTTLLVAELDFGTTGQTPGSRVRRLNLTSSGNTVTAADAGIVKALPGRSVTGITTRNGNELWISHAQINPTYQANTNIGAYTSAVMRCSGANLANCTDVITGLPRSAELHQTNGLFFKPGTNLLFIAQGGNTNYGAPSGSFGNRGEVLMSGAILVADVSKIGSGINVQPKVEGGTTYEITNNTLLGNPSDSLPVRVYATGLRNPYDLVWTTAGKLFATDNGGNVGFGTTPACGGAPAYDPGNSDDELNDIQLGGYYGHPNPARGQCIYEGGPGHFGPVVKTGLNYGSDGITEYTGPFLGTNVQPGDLLYVNYAQGDNLYRWRPSNPGEPPQVIVAQLVNPLDVVNDSRGTIFVVEFGSPFDKSQPARVSYLRP